MSRSDVLTPATLARLCTAIKALSLALLAAWLLAFLTIGYPWTMVGSSFDALSYLWMADALSHGVSSPEAAFGSHLLFHGRLPPGYPIYLSAFGASAGAEGLWRANVAQIIAVLAMAGLLCTYVWSRTGSGLTVLLVTLYTLAHPMITPWSFELFSEPLYTGLLLAVCLIAGSERLPRAWLWAALLLGVACLVRSMGLVLIPALVWWLARRSWPRAILAGVVAAAPTVIWSVLKGPPGEGAGGSYLAQLQTQLASAGGQWLEFALTQGTSLVRSLAPGALPEPLRLILGAALLLLFARLAWRERRSPSLDTLFVLATLAILAIWPFPGYLDRLSGPLVPLLLVAVIRAVTSGNSTDPKQTPGIVWISSGTLVIMLSMLMTLAKLTQPSIRSAEAELRPFIRNASVLGAEDPTFIAQVHLASSLAASGLSEQVPAGQCVSTTFAYWVRLFSPVPVSDTVSPFSWGDNPCRFIFLINLASPRDGFNGIYPMPLPQDQYSLVFVSSETPDKPMLAALIERKD
ncbi:MAG: hypothetical protein R3F18_02010 [Lysobacterales bacterium]